MSISIADENPTRKFLWIRYRRQTCSSRREGDTTQKVCLFFPPFFIHRGGSIVIQYTLAEYRNGIGTITVRSAAYGKGCSEACLYEEDCQYTGWPFLYRKAVDLYCAKSHSHCSLLSVIKRSYSVKQELNLIFTCSGAPATSQSSLF